MLVSGADLRFVAAAVQSWSLPQSAADDKLSRRAQGSLKLSLAVLCLAGLVNLAQSVVCGSSCLALLIVAWLAAETLYFIYGHFRYAAVNQVVEVPLDPERVELIKERFLTLASVMPMEEFLSGWFQGVPASEVKRQNLEEFVAYGFYCRTLEQLPPKLRRSVKQFVRDVEEAYGHNVEEGYNPNITFMAHMWEPLRTFHTPLCIHVASEASNLMATLVLRLWGFRKYTCQGVGYWFRPGKVGALGAEGCGSGRRRVVTRSMSGSVHIRGDSASDLGEASGRNALVFIHGVGFGIAPYLGFLWPVCRAAAASPVFLLDVPHVSMRPFRRAKNVDAIASAVQAILHRHGLPQACFAGHSFGSFCVSRICQLHPEIVDSIVLMDPVCCMTCFPQLLHTFVYKACTPREAVSSLLGFSSVVRFIFSRDLIIAETFCRQFLWHSLMLWPEDMPAKAVLSLSAYDDLVPAPLVMAHLDATQSPAEVLYHPTAGHGGIFLDMSHQQRLVGHIQRLLGAC